MADIQVSPIMYINGCRYSFPTTASILISPGQLRDSTNSYDIMVPSDLTISTSVSGAGGIDSGTLTNDKVYNIFVIASSVGFLPTSAVISLSDIPYLPEEYDLFRKIGFCAVSGGGDLFRMYQDGNGTERVVTPTESIFVLLPGHATTFTNVDLSQFIPSIPNIPVLFLATYTPQAVGNTFSLKSPSASLFTNSGTGIIAGQDQTSQIRIVTNLVGGKPSVAYRVLNAADQLVLSIDSVYFSL